jgi:RND family efflux transporter MFP subunit
MHKILLFSLLSLFIVFTSCKKKKQNEKLETYLVANPMVIDTTYASEYVAEIQSLQNVEIRSRTTGFIEKQFIDEGKIVQEGQLLFRISSKQLEQNLQSAKSAHRSTLAELKSVEIELENTSRLLEKNIVSKTEMELMKSKVEEMKAKVEEKESDMAEAEHNLTLAQIKAPFTGIINRIPNKIGSLVEEGTLMTSLSNNSEMLVYFNVSENVYLDYVEYKTNAKPQQISMVLANNELYPYQGVIETVEGEFDKSTGNIAFRAKFPNPDQILKHGSSGKVLIENKLKKALVIPQKSTFEIQDNTYAFVLDSENIVKMRRIIPKLRMQNLFVIESGIKQDDRFIVEGVQLVKDGDKIAPQSISSAEVLKSLPN